MKQGYFHFYLMKYISTFGAWSNYTGELLYLVYLTPGGLTDEKEKRWKFLNKNYVSLRD